MARLRSVPEIVASQGDLVVERDPARPSGRLLRQGEMEASYVDLADPTHLEFDYMRWLRIVLRAARARRILHIGGAACALARALAAELPGGRQEVCELDATVLEVARAHMGLRRAPGLRVRRADGRAFLATQPAGRWDAIVVDAFIGARIPRRLITAEALGDAARVAPLTLVNVVDDRAAGVERAVAAGLATAYPRVWALGARMGNRIVAGQRTSLGLDRIAAEAAGDPSPARLTGPLSMTRLIDGLPARRDDEDED